MKQILHLQPVFKERLWGGTRLAEFGYELPGDHVGECWGISAHPCGLSTVIGGAYDGMTLDALWRGHRELFGDLPGEEFPLLVKIIDAKDDLSIQVHPNDAYAAKFENGAKGKSECWYVLDAKPGDTIVIGHNAKDRGELEAMIRGGRWGELIREIPVKAGDFFNIEPGCVHAIKGGTMILETQENSDITYRLYDYDRLQNGKKRELHIDRCLDVIRVPFEPAKTFAEIRHSGDATLTVLMRSPYFTVYKADLDGSASFAMRDRFYNVSIIDGEVSIDGETFRKGDHLILCAGYGETVIEGRASAVVSRI